GLVFPCCWMGAIYVPPQERATHEIWRALQNLPGGLEAINARKRPLAETVEGPFFETIDPDGGQGGTAGAHGLKVCASVWGARPVGRASSPPLTGVPTAASTSIAAPN